MKASRSGAVRIATFRPESDERPILFLDDLEVGQTFGGRLSIIVDEAAMLAFEEEFHLRARPAREAAPMAGGGGAIVASGWYVAAVTMRLLCEDGPRVDRGMIGTGVEALSWDHPVRPGDCLTMMAEILGIRESPSRPDRGFVRIKVETFNQDGDTVQTCISGNLVFRKGWVASGGG